MPTVDQRAMARLKENRDNLTRQQLKTLRGQILAGNAEAAMKGLERIVGRK